VAIQNSNRIFKSFYILIVTLGLFACNHKTDELQVLQNRIDSLETNAYKPGLGDFMGSIQVHHAKLWFAAQNKNWELADFEIHEIKENLSDIKKYCGERPESKSIGMINQSMAEVYNSILKKDQALFEKSYIDLTNSCNACHQATNHEFNVIKIPNTPPFSNQDFKINEPK